MTSRRYRPEPGDDGGAFSPDNDHCTTSLAWPRTITSNPKVKITARRNVSTKQISTGLDQPLTPARIDMGRRRLQASQGFAAQSLQAEPTSKAKFISRLDHAYIPFPVPQHQREQHGKVAAAVTSTEPYLQERSKDTTPIFPSISPPSTADTSGSQTSCHPCSACTAS